MQPKWQRARILPPWCGKLGRPKMGDEIWVKAGNPKFVDHSGWKSRKLCYITSMRCFSCLDCGEYQPIQAQAIELLPLFSFDNEPSDPVKGEDDGLLYISHELHAMLLAYGTRWT